MKVQNILTSLLATSLLIVGCTQGSPEAVHDDINQSLAINSESKDIFDWENSDFTPEKIFAKWKKDQVSAEDICKTLTSRNGKDLSFLEAEIKDEENKSLVAPCKEELLKSIDTYYKEEKKKMFPEVSENMNGITGGGGSFSFPDRVEYRDVSNGYFATRGDVDRKEVVLTFDDGPHPQYTESILADLAAVNAKVIFFAMGKSVKANPEVLKKSASMGHMIGSHSVTHACLAQNKRCDSANQKSLGRTLSYADSVAEIKGGHRAVEKVLGWVAPFFRFPYGESSPKVKELLRNNGVGEFYWNVDSNDWRSQSPKQVADGTLKQIEQQGRGVVLFHDVQRRTAEMMPYFLKQLYYKGYTVVLLKPTDENSLRNSKLTK